MSVIGFNIAKIDAERKNAPKGKVNVESNVTIKKVEVSNVSLGNANEKVLDFNFEFKTNYSPDIGHIIVSGNLLFLTKSEDAEKISEEWSKTKKLEKDVMKPVFNTVLARGNIQAMIISKDLNLPAPIQLPRMKDN